MKEYTAEEWLPSASGLGESPLYRQEDDTFFFADIKNCLVHCVPLSRGWAGRYTVHLDEPITRLEIVEGRLDILAVQTRLGFALLNSTSGAIQQIAVIRHEEDASLKDKVRMNDGGIDARGRWWAGSMALDEEAAIGRLWRLDGGNVKDMSAGNEDERAAVINGPVWSPDGKIMYTCNTPEGKIYQSKYDVENGTTNNKRLFAHLEDGGMPDGLAVDSEGHIWAAANSQGKLVRISPQGEVVATCVVPGAKMTSCPAFGGKDMKTLFITSISADGSTGNVYRARVDIPGIPRNEFKL
ncbi:hypothetical protein F5B22DRAFT_288136 [Xylaria bambusicola]|uniref:uncharacterized protein n=1 Tax=Xylaria bambusicola TaxID=326684 RepID=UPI00200725C0|nr:uncharacterized protein F5B22DRAFT_288136 [Xylaria bambusicola]KAI0512884.1 hypothetical protein F5B22DRAFT_288136 [Xylaria bambusicola]